MAGEVIRDVVIRVSVQQGQGGNTAFDSATKGAQATTGAVNTLNQSFNQVINNAVTFGQRAEKTMTAVEQELQKVTMQVRELAEAYVFAGQKGGDELDELIARQKVLQGVLKESEALVRKVSGGDKPEPKPSGPGFFSTQNRFGELGGVIGKAAIPVTVLAMAPQAAGAIGETLKGLSIDLFGTARERQQGGLFTSESGRAGGNALANAGFRFLGSDFMQAILGNQAGGGGVLTNAQRAVFGSSAADVGAQFNQERRAAEIAGGNTQSPFDLLQREVQLREQGLALLEQTYAKEKDALNRELSLTEDRIRMNQAVIEAEQAKLDAAQQQFGLLDATERATFKGAADKIKDGGLGSLSKDELNLLRGNQAFSGLFQDEAMQAADAAGWKEIVDSLGLDEKIKAEEAQLELNLQQKMEITADLSNIDAAVNKFRDALLESQKKLAEEMLTRVRLEIARAMRDTKGPSGPDF